MGGTLYLLSQFKPKGCRKSVADSSCHVLFIDTAEAKNRLSGTAFNH